MYKLIIVDDETNIRQGIAESIPWAEWGFSITGQASNGLEAIRLIKQEKPDVVLSDIRMPKMDGVELMKYLHQNYPEIKIIILSGYNDIEYLNMSIKNRVTEYLLKPTNLEEFRVLFARLRRNLDHEYSQRQEFEKLKKFYEENQLQSNARFLNRLIKGGFPNREQIGKLFAECGLPLELSQCAVLYLDIDHLEEKLQNQPGLTAQMLRAEVCRLCGKAPAPMQRVFFLNDSGELIGIVSPGFSGGSQKELAMFVETIQSEAKNELSLSLSVGISDWCRDPLALPQFYLQAKICMNQRLFFGSGCILFYRDFHEDASFSYRSLHFDQDRIISGVVSSDPAFLQEELEHFFALFKGKMIREYDVVDRICMEFLFHLSHWTTSFQLNLDEFLSSQGIHYTDVNRYDTLEGKSCFLLGILKQLAGRFAASKNSANSKMVFTIKKYIDENYLSNKISLEFIADKIHKNPAYVSRLFKSETGDNFSEYVTQKRMEKSQELLLDPSLKVYEIAEKTGYADVSNFIKVFRKYYGISPTEYRSRVGAITGKDPSP